MQQGQDRVASRQIANLVGERYEHERMTGPDVQVIRVQEEGRLAVGLACRHPELEVVVGNIRLLEVHSGVTDGHRREGVAALRVCGLKMRQDIPYDPHQLTPHDRVAAVLLNVGKEVVIGVLQ